MNSHKTAISRIRPSVPARFLYENDLIVGKALDYGCGKGRDADTYGMSKYDPHYAPYMPKGKFDTIMCNYVVNTVNTEVEATILSKIKQLLHGTGIAYITVRRDIVQEGVTKKGTYQRKVYLDLPVVKETDKFCIYVMKGKE